MDNTHSDATAFSRPELARLWDAARRRLERNGRKITTNPIELTGLTEDEVIAICSLLARRRPSGDEIRVSLSELDNALRASRTQLGVVETLEATSGPVDDRSARRAAERKSHADLWQSAEAHPIISHEPARLWITSMRQRGRLTRLAVDDPGALLTAALDCLGWLVSNRGSSLEELLPLSVVAAAQFGDAHALDSDTALGAVVADAILALSGAAELRAAWLTFGIQLDSVSSAALTYMLPGAPGTIAGAACGAAEVLRVTYRMLDRGFGLRIRPNEVVWVCENPSIVALAADRLGSKSQPLVCLEGMPSSVTGRLLAALRQAGAILHVHADFDFGGIAIMSHVTSRLGAEAWRMGHEDYLTALGGPTTDLPQIIGTTSWDPQLAAVMNHHRRAVHEEAIFATLLSDLRA